MNSQTSHALHSTYAHREAELGFDDTIEQIASGEYEGEPADAIKISPVAQFHSKLTLATSSVPCLPWLVSAGHDGCLRVWDADQNKMVGVYTFGTFAPCVFLVCFQRGPALALTCLTHQTNRFQRSTGRFRLPPLRAERAHRCRLSQWARRAELCAWS